MGAIDLVIQVESPPQRGARAAAHRPRRPPGGGAQPRAGVPQVPRRPARVRRRGRRAHAARRHRGDARAAAAAGRPGPADRGHVLRRDVDASTTSSALVRGAYPFAELSREQLEGVLDMLAGRYPSDEFAELRPRRGVGPQRRHGPRPRRRAVRWRCRTRARSPTAGLYAVVLPDGARVGELDEEMVYEARTGQTFMLGASTWRIEEITRDRVVVTPAPGRSGGRPVLEGRGRGPTLRARRGRGTAGARAGRRRARARGRPAAGRERASTGAPRPTSSPTSRTRPRPPATVPSDRAIVVERFRDEIGDWRLCVLTPFGARVHAPWALALGARAAPRPARRRTRSGATTASPSTCPTPTRRPPPTSPSSTPTSSRSWSLGELGGTALFGARFRENAARALLIPRRRPGQRTPLWQQRLKALVAARRWRASFGSFPVILETYRECLDDWFDLPALRGVLGRVRSRELAVVEVETATASPFAGSLLFEYVASYMYEDDTPAGRAARAGARRSTATCCASCSARRSCATSSTPTRWPTLEADLQGLVRARPRARRRRPARPAAPHRRPLAAEIAPRGWRPGRGRRRWSSALVAERRAVRDAAWAARSASSPPRTPAATATGSA